MRQTLAGHPVFGICGHKNSGKTTLVCRLVEEFARRGLRVATVKFCHCEIELDEPGRDSYRHRQAGATHVAVVSPTRWGVFHELPEGAPRPDLAEVLPALRPADLVLVEGNKSGAFPKLEMHDVTASAPLLAESDPHIVAIAANGVLTYPRLPVFHRDDLKAIAAFILDHLRV